MRAVIQAPSCRSSAVAPESTYGTHNSCNTVPEPIKVITGALPAITVTVLSLVGAGFQDKSVTS